MELFRGYVLTKDKKCIEKFKNRTDFKTYEQVKSLPEFAGILNNDVILIDIDDGSQAEILYRIIEDLKLNCRVYKTSRGMHFLFKNTTVETCKTHTKLAIGLTADIKLGSRNSYSILKFDGKERQILYDTEEVDPLPTWLLPVRSNIDFMALEEGDGRNQSYFNYILTLQSFNFTIEEIRECIRLINKYVISQPLDDEELEVILREDSFQQPSFFKDKTFLFDKFANYLKNNHHIIKINGQLHMYKDGVYVAGLEQIEAIMIKHIPNLNRTKRQEVLAYLQVLLMSNTPVTNANYIAFKNGIYDLDKDELLDFDPSIIVTNKINYNYNENAYSEVVDKTLNKLACDDENIRLLLEEIVGYTFFKRNELRKAFILIGDKSNGKSTYLDMIKTLLGDENVSALDLKDFSHEFKVANIFGKLANIGDDISDEFIVDTAMFKKIVSGDRINTNKKFEKPFDFNPFCKLLFSANAIPRMGKSRGNEAIIDRLIIVPFEARFSVNDPDFDPYIKYKLRTDEAMEYLIQIGLDGLSRVLDNRRFTTSDKVQKELEEYEENNNPILLFFKEIEEDDILNNSTVEVYKKYNEFCLSNNFTPMSNIEFSRKIKKYFGFDISRKMIKGKAIKIFTKEGWKWRY